MLFDGEWIAVDNKARSQNSYLADTILLAIESTFLIEFSSWEWKVKQTTL